jgi:uncharacterized membrane protein YfcA
VELFILLLIGLAAGLVSGFLGVGGGIVVIPALVGLLHYSQQEAQGTALGLLLPPIGLLAVINYYNAGFVHLKASLIMAITFLVGSYFSSKIAVTLPEGVIKKAFAVFLLYYALDLFFNKS